MDYFLPNLETIRPRSHERCLYIDRLDSLRETQVVLQDVACSRLYTYNKDNLRFSLGDSLN